MMQCKMIRINHLNLRRLTVAWARQARAHWRQTWHRIHIKRQAGQNAVRMDSLALQHIWQLIAEHIYEVLNGWSPTGYLKRSTPYAYRPSPQTLGPNQDILRHVLSSQETSLPTSIEILFADQPRNSQSSPKRPPAAGPALNLRPKGMRHHQPSDNSSIIPASTQPQDAMSEDQCWDPAAPPPYGEASISAARRTKGRGS